MNLMFLTSSSLSAMSGPQARLIYEMESLVKNNEVSIVCLGAQPDTEETKEEFQTIKFYHFPIRYEGWSVLNTQDFIDYLDLILERSVPDLIILNIEIWDLMRALGAHFKNKIAFATVVHAMPFLASPLEPSGNFERDALLYANSGLQVYRKKYIMDHYKEVQEVLQNVSIIANNLTVAHYFKIYFPVLRTWTQSPSLVAKKQKPIFEPNPKYDFVYMARMEKGKGVEYLSKILSLTTRILQRPVTIAILGKTDDTSSREALESLLATNLLDSGISIDYKGWANAQMKSDVLGNSGVFLYPSHYDNYPTVLNEALVFGLPCITWDIVYSQLNYSATNVVYRVPLLNYEKFAEAAVAALQERPKLFKDALQFVNGFGNCEQTARLDTELFMKLA